PFVFAFNVAEYAYLEVRNTFTRKHIPQTWPDISKMSLKIAEQKEVFPGWPHLVAKRACETIQWLFNHSSNKSVKNVVVGALCALLEEWNSKEYLLRKMYFDKVVSSPEYIDLFFSAAKHSLSQSSDITVQSATDQDLEQRTCFRLISNLMKISSSKKMFDEAIAQFKKNWRGKISIEEVWIHAYREALCSRYRTLSRRLLDWGEHMLQSNWGHDILIACAGHGDAEDIRDLVDRGMNLNSHRCGGTALHQAVTLGNLDAIIALSQREPALLSAQAVVSGDRVTALELAMKYRKPDVVACLLDHGAQTPNALHDAV
ncbi:hypothetical protein C0993_010662, partial [Termitomyces sp. T159_Od127]